MPTRKKAAAIGFDPKRLTIDDLMRLFVGPTARERAQGFRRLTGGLKAPYKVEDVPSTSPNEISHFRSYYKNPDFVEGKIVLKRPNRHEQTKECSTTSKKAK